VVKGFMAWHEGTKGRIYQSGFHVASLCIDCNRNTGSWYGTEFTKWSEWGHQLVEAVYQPHDAEPTMVPVYTGFPARIGKQVLSTMLAASQLELGDDYARLRELVLDRNTVATPGEIDLAMYLSPASAGRSTGIAGVGKRQPDGSVTAHKLVEVASPPFGYVLSLAGGRADPRPIDISWFLTCRYDEERTIDLEHIPVLATYLPFPADYRTRNEIRRDWIENTLGRQNHPTPRDEAERIMAAGEGADFMRDHGGDWTLRR
jgi:hypothetical protein